MKNRSFLLLALIAATATIAIGIRSVAQSNSPAPNMKPTNVMSAYIEAAELAVINGTAATNLTQAERGRLMNESIKTNLAAQLWFRQAMSGRASDWGVKMAVELRALESLRAGNTNEVIRVLEESLDSDIVSLGTLLKAGAETKAFRTTRQPLESLQWAKEYRDKFPHTAEDSAMDERVKAALSEVGGN